jgi:hypothetical protein
MKRTLDIDPAHCPRCEGRLEPIAIITLDDIVQRIPLNLPASPEPMDPGGSMAWDLGDERMGDWVLGMDPEPPEVDVTQRSPPCDQRHFGWRPGEACSRMAKRRCEGLQIAA